MSIAQSDYVIPIVALLCQWGAMARPKQKMDIKLHPEARRIIEGAIASGVKQVELAEYAGVEPNIISKILGEERRFMASEFIGIVQGLGYQIEKPSPAEPALPSEATIRTVLKVVLSSERSALDNEDDLQVYGRLVRTVLDDVASGRVAEDRQDLIEYGLRRWIEEAFRAKYAQVG